MRSIRIALAVVAATAVAAVGTASPALGGSTQEPNIVETAAAAGKFKTLSKLLGRAGLADTLTGAGPYTVFAPTDAAFAKVPKRKLNALKQNKAKLKAVLLYHVAAGRLTASEVVQRSSIKTLNGRKARVRVRGSNVFLNRARVTTPDVTASNGVIHVINRVLIPRAG